ncbi:MAG: hypothetical protein U9P14_13080 [Gemmatimonadota bacterium]|nr:hypothetical protein [Gemmatimonadota bacterium]
MPGHRSFPLGFLVGKSLERMPVDNSRPIDHMQVCLGIIKEWQKQQLDP